MAFAGIFLIFRKQYLPGAILSILGVVWFILVTKVLIPFFAGDTGYGYWSYGHLGPDLPSAVLGMLQNPVFAVSLLFWPLVKMVTLVRMSITVVGLCYLSPLVLLSAPIILERFLSSTPTHWMFGFHYGAVIAPVFVLAFIDALHRLRNNKLRITKPLRRRHAISVILWGVLAVNAGLFVAFTSSSLLNPSYYRLTADESAGYNLIKQIPSDVTVCTSNRIVPHLGRREVFLIGDGVATIREDCEYIITSSSIDQHSSLQEALGNAKRMGFTEVVSEGSYTILRK